MGSVNLDSLKVQFKGKPFNQLIKYHLRRQKNTLKLREATIGTLAMLSESAYQLDVDFIDKWNERVYEQSFRGKDTSEVFVEIIDDARSFLLSVGIPTDDETLFNMFQIVVLSYAYSASDQPTKRKFIGI